MSDIPVFKIYWEDNISIRNTIQAKLPLRKWSELTKDEKRIAFQHIENSGWLKDHGNKILEAIEDLNFHFLRICPWKNLHKIVPEKPNHWSMYWNEHLRRQNAWKDFEEIFINESNDAIFLRMISVFISWYIDQYSYKNAEKSKIPEERELLINKAFEKIDRCCNCFNHVFDQFSVDVFVTRNWIVPKEDLVIIETIVKPTLEALSDPKWKDVNNDMNWAFDSYQKENYNETITRVHSAVQRFLQIQLGEEEWKNGQWELNTLFVKFKNKRKTWNKEIIEAIERGLQSFLSNSRANNSTAKPALKNATSQDALLMINISLVLFQHILQTKG
jgi:hypothetical protein